MRYCCHFPSCTYETDVKSYIHLHHIVPRELGGTNLKYNRFYVCPNHHQMLYVKEATSGMHTVFAPGCIMVIGWKSAGDRMFLNYVDHLGIEKYYDPVSRKEFIV